ncbi:MAG: thioesterase family protein [Nevskiales bacterium]
MLHMVCLFRMLKVLLSQRWRPRLAVLETSVLRFRVWPNDLDMNIHMNNGRYFSIADIGRLDWWLRTGLWRAARAQGLAPVAGDSNARFSRAMHAFECYELHSRLLGWNEKWLFAEHRFVQGGRVTATVLVRYLFRSRDGHGAPAQVLALIGFTQPSPPLPAWVEGWHHAQNQLTASLKSA